LRSYPSVLGEGGHPFGLYTFLHFFSLDPEDQRDILVDVYGSVQNSEIMDHFENTVYRKYFDTNLYNGVLRQLRAELDNAYRYVPRDQNDPPEVLDLVFSDPEFNEENLGTHPVWTRLREVCTKFLASTEIDADGVLRPKNRT